MIRFFLYLWIRSVSPDVFLLTQTVLQLHWYYCESPFIFPIGRNKILRFGLGAPAVISAYSHLLHVYTNFYEILGRDIVDMCLARLDVSGSRDVMFQLCRIAVVPLIISVYVVFAVKVFNRIAQRIETDSLIGIDSQPFAILLAYG